MGLELSSVVPAMPEIMVLTMATVTLLAEIMMGKRFRNLSYMLVLLTLVMAFVLSLFQLGDFRTLGFYRLFVLDDIAVLMKLFIYITAFLSFFYARRYVDEREMPRGEYYVLGLFSVFGMMVLVSANTLLVVYLGLELMSLPLYAMIALRRENSLASEASMKYFIMGAIASGMLLYGMSMLYGATGSLELQTIATNMTKAWAEEQMMVSFAVVFLVVGVCFKLALVPFHMWAPDVYDGAPSSVTAFLSSAPKIAALGMAIRLFVFALPMVEQQWQPLFLIVSILSVIIGNVFAVAQSNIKRMLAYSGISHMGFALFGILAATNEGYSASLYYVLAYGLMSVAGFGLVVLMSHKGFEAEKISDFKGLNKKNPWLAFLMLVTMFSMAGVPPTFGFFAKFLVLKALVNAGFVKLAAIALLFAVVGAYYYIRIVKTMYFEAPEENTPIKVPKELTLALSLNTLALLVMGIFPNALISACINAFLR